MRRIQIPIWIVALLLPSLAGCGGAASGIANPNPPPPSATSRVAPTSVDFGNELVDTTAPALSVAYQNTGSGSLAITAISATGDYAQSNNCGSSLASGATCTLRVSFTPTAVGTLNGNLQILGDSSQTVPLTGVGITMHNVQLSWNPSTSSVIGYYVYLGQQSGGPYSLQNSSPEPLTSFQESVPGGQNGYFVVTAVDANLVESVPSNEAEAIVPP